MDLMQFRGVPPYGSPGLGTYVAFGGILMLLGSIGEWILGNTFPCVVFGSFGAFWIALTLTLTPYMGAAAANKVTAPGGITGAAFNNSFGMI